MKPKKAWAWVVNGKCCAVVLDGKPAWVPSDQLVRVEIVEVPKLCRSLNLKLQKKTGGRR